MLGSEGQDRRVRIGELVWKVRIGVFGSANCDQRIRIGELGSQGQERKVGIGELGSEN